MVEIEAASFTPQSAEEEDADELLTLSQRFHRKSKTNPSHLLKKLKIRLGTKKKGHARRRSLTKPTGSEKTSGAKRCKWKMTEKRKGLSDGRISALMERAAEVQSSLDPQFPSFLKLMLRSHVTHGFWMGLPQSFGRLYLPNYDTAIILEGEDGIVYQTNFISERVGLSGGWRGFSLAHKLVEGDIVVFHLVLPCKFKVYIVRANRLPEPDGAMTLIHLDDSASETDLACNEKPIRRCQRSNQSRQMPLFPDIHPDMSEVNDRMAINPHLAPEADESANSRAVATSVTSEDMDICELPNLSNPFVDFQDFKIIVNGTIIDSELSKHLQAKYYELCCSKNSYLHGRLKCINRKLATGIISETMNIADAIRASNYSTCLDDYKAWDKTLEAFEMLGVEVGFLRARLNRLIDLVLGSTEEVDSKRYEEASCERGQVEEEIRNLELKLLELKQTRNGLDKEMESLKEKTTRYKIMFQEEAGAAW